MSLHRRLLLSALIVVIILIPLMGYGLIHAVRLTLTESFDARVNALLNVAIASLEEDEFGQLTWQDRLADARFQQLYSGWYWQVADSEQVLFRSPSLFDTTLTLPTHDTAGVVLIMGPNNHRLRAHVTTVRRAEHPLPLQVIVAGNSADIEESLDFFEWLTVAGLSVFALLLITMLTVQIRWGLRPLRRLQRQVSGLAAHQNLPESLLLPAELTALAQAIRQALERNERLLEHARLTAGNLAHALKTPLSVLQSYAENLPEADQSEVNQQAFLAELNRMHLAIQHHLSRASALGEYRAHAPVLVASILAPVVAALNVIAKNSEVQLHTEIDSHLALRMDGQDLQELVGNLVENAIRYGRRNVWLVCNEMYLQVMDDGDGISAGQQQKILQRGTRLDEQGNGFGLGLAIVSDIAKTYGLTLEILSPAAQGSCWQIQFNDKVRGNE